MNLREYAEQQKRAKLDSSQTEKAADTAPAEKAPAAQVQLPTIYKQIYREVFNFHARHTPAPATLEEWEAAAEDLTRTAAAINKPFAHALLSAVYEELERQSMETQRKKIEGTSNDK